MASVVVFLSFSLSRYLELLRLFPLMTLYLSFKVDGDVLPWSTSEILAKKVNTTAMKRYFFNMSSKLKTKDKINKT